MTHPVHLHVRAALHSLRAALVRLESLDTEDGDRGTLRAWAPSDRRGGGSRAGLADVVSRPARRDLAAEVGGTMAWLFADRTIEGEIKDPSPRTISALAWIEELDAKIRTALRMGTDHEPMPGAECPVCGMRTLSRRTLSGIVVCACVCRGPACACGSVPPVEGMSHAWEL